MKKTIALALLAASLPGLICLAAEPKPPAGEAVPSAAQLSRIRSACSNEIQLLCKGLSEEDGTLLACLRENRDAATASCGATLDALTASPDEPKVSPSWTYQSDEDDEPDPAEELALSGSAAERYA